MTANGVDGPPEYQPWPLIKSEFGMVVGVTEKALIWYLSKDELNITK